MIYDCFTFFNELDLLEIRLNILDATVDKFVLVEATKTHQGHDKPLHYAENKARFARFENKIIHVVVDECPPVGEDSWVLERYQRNMIANGLANCKPGDVILISDADEIPDPVEIIRWKDEKGIKIFRQKMYYYFLNCVNSSNSATYRWNGTVMVHYSALTQPQDLRELSMRFLGLHHSKFINRVYWHLWKYFKVDLRGEKVKLVKDGGWHFSYLGGADAIIKKLEAFAHSEYNKEEFKDPEKIMEAINAGKDILGREFSYKFVAIDNTFPKYIQDNTARFSHLIKK